MFLVRFGVFWLTSSVCVCYVTPALPEEGPCLAARGSVHCLLFICCSFPSQRV
jgi:hypothetical protein